MLANIILCSEPCIRGHRSTKCTHAGERLMVPVKKPGRPLSACPHAKDQVCGCGGVTAAIPRNKPCGCGPQTPSVSSAPTLQDPVTSDISSPTKPAYKVQKSAGRPQSSRKQSYDPANFGRMDVNSINILQYEQRTQSIQVPFPNGYATAGSPQAYGYLPQYSSIQADYNQYPVQGPAHGLPTMNGNTIGFVPDLLPNTFGHVTSQLHMVGTSLPPSMDTTKATTGGSCCASPVPNSNSDSKGGTNGDFTTRPPNHSHSSSSASSVSEPQEMQASCCSSKSAPLMTKVESFSSQGSPIDMIPQIPKREPFSNQGTPNNMTPPLQYQALPPKGAPFNQVVYSQYLPPHTTIFTYPATYGSFENPLQPSTWMANVRTNIHTAQSVPDSAPTLPYAPTLPGMSETIHTCGCGDECQCIGCAAHPYNEATKQYVRNAMSEQEVRPEAYINRTTPINGNDAGIQPQGIDTSSPTTQTPSSTTSVNGEGDQILDGEEFLFVNYNFDGEGCDGDIQSCPCGDDCECIGCTIHKPELPIPCLGAKDFCPCGDECECIGCEQHNGLNGTTVT